MRRNLRTGKSGKSAMGRVGILVGIHLITGLLGIALGFAVVGGMLARKPLRGWHGPFLFLTLMASVTGFVFMPAYGFSSAQLVGVFSVLILSLAIYGRYVKRLSEIWKPVYIVCAVAGLFLNVLIAVTQSFEHFAFLKRIAPSQDAPTFVAVKWGLLCGFIAIGFSAVNRSNPSAA
jgi:hypothetical protein